jgi:hypothetical protein
MSHRFQPAEPPSTAPLNRTRSEPNFHSPMAVGMGVGVLFQLRLGLVADAPAGKIPERVVWFSRMTARISLPRDSIGSHRSGCCVPSLPDFQKRLDAEKGNRYHNICDTRDCCNWQQKMRCCSRISSLEALTPSPS